MHQTHQSQVIHYQKTVTCTSNRNFEQNLLSNQTLPVFFPTKNPMIDDIIAPIGRASQTLSIPPKKEVIVDAACGGMWVNQNLRQVIRTGVDGSTPGDVCNFIRIKHAPSPVLIGSMTTSPPCGLSRRLQVAKKRQSTSPGLGRNTEQLDNVVDVKLPDDLDPVYIFSKAIGHKLSDGSNNDLYLRCRMNFANDTVQNQAPHFMDLGLLDTNKLNERGVIGTPATKIRMPKDGSHWMAPYHVFGETTAVGMSAEKSDHEYCYKTGFEIWRENKEFEHQHILMSRPPLDSTPIGTNMTNITTSHLESTPIETKTPDPKPLTRPTY